MTLCPRLVPRITALARGSGRSSFPIPIPRVNLAEPLLRRSRKAALCPDGVIRGVLSNRPETERFIPFVFFPSRVAALRSDEKPTARRKSAVSF